MAKYMKSVSLAQTETSGRLCGHGNEIFLRQLNESYYLKWDFAALLKDKCELLFLREKYGWRSPRNVYALRTEVN
jgi:hypothetical protein